MSQAKNTVIALLGHYGAHCAPLTIGPYALAWIGRAAQSAAKFPDERRGRLRMDERLHVRNFTEHFHDLFVGRAGTYRGFQANLSGVEKAGNQPAVGA